MKLIALILAGLFLATTAAPADAVTTRVSKTTTSVQNLLIPGAQGCCG